MKNSNQILTSTTGRTLIYLSVFVIGSALHELLSQLINPVVWSNGALVLTLSTLSAFILVGVLFACERHVVFRVTSAATLLILGFIALRIGHSVVPDPYLFVIALCVAIIGAQSVLHRKLASRKRAIAYSLITIFISLVTVVAFAYGMTVLDRIVIQQQYDSRD